jgi:enamine deaminase RidA (YjgF/YER057c/UK114 family)
VRKMLVPREFSNIPEQWHFAPVLDTGEFVFFSGITGVRSDGSLSVDPATQFRDAFSFVAMHLETAGLQFDDIVEMTTYHVGLRKHLHTFIAVKDEYEARTFAEQSVAPRWT